MPSDDATQFDSTERYYAEFRPDYGEAVVEYLVDEFDVDADARVLDLGCGAGQPRSRSPRGRGPSSGWTRTRRC